MTTCTIMNNTLTDSIHNDNDFLNTLIKENEQLKSSNNKLYKRTLNLKRKNLRLKKMLNDTNSASETYTPEEINEEQNIADVIWEDINDLIGSYENDAIN
jgi:hypothetical protein